MLSYLTDDYAIIKTRFKVGKQLTINDTATNGLYAIVSKRTNKVLRITLFKEIADSFRDDSRYITEVFLVSN